MNSRLDRHRRSQTQNATPVLVRKHREYSCYWCTSVSCVPFCMGRSADLMAARRGREAHGWGRGYGFFAVCVQSAVCAERKRPTGARKNEEKEEQKEAAPEKVSLSSSPSNALVPSFVAVTVTCQLRGYHHQVEWMEGGKSRKKRQDWVGMDEWMNECKKENRPSMPLTS